LIDTGAGQCGEGILPVGYDSSAEVARRAPVHGSGRGPGLSGRAGWCSTGGGERTEPVEAVDGEAGPGCVGGQAQHDAPGVTGGLGGQGEQPEPEPEPCGFPSACGVLGEGEQLGP
jgi:hypothetical protein